MLASMKLLCLTCWPDDVKKIDQLRLDFVMSMLKSPHFNARMNALKEVRSFFHSFVVSLSGIEEVLIDF